MMNSVPIQHDDVGALPLTVRENHAAAFDRTIVRDAPHAFVLMASARSLVFTLVQIEQLAAHHPGADVHVLCTDDEAAEALRRHVPGIHVISPDLAGTWDADARALQDSGDDMRPVLSIVHGLFSTRSDIERIAVVGSDLAVMATLPAPPPGHVRFGDWSMGSAMDYVREVPRRCAPAYFAVDRHALTRTTAHLPGDIPAASGDVAEAARRAGLVVDVVAIDTPWSDAAAEPRPCLALLGPLACRGAGRWECLPYASAAGWQAYASRVYMPQVLRAHDWQTRVPLPTPHGDPLLRSSSRSWSDVLVRHEFGVAHGYRMLSKAQYAALAAQASGWDSPSVAAAQHGCFRRLIDDFTAGRQRADMRALTRILGSVATADASILEQGCGSGYNGELIRLAAGPGVRYTGIDTAAAMVRMAREHYPQDRFEVMPSEHLDFGDGSFDVVINGASLMHTIDYGRALSEARRVAARYVVLHTLTVADTPHDVHFEKIAYGGRVPEVCFSARGIHDLLESHGLMPVQVEESIPYDLSRLIGAASRSVSIACFCLPPPRDEPNHYCTYFDANYLPRGVLMIRSLKRHDATAVVHVLCCDDLTHSAMVALSIDGVRPIRMSELVDADPGFAGARHDRTRIEWYFTATSCLVNLLVHRLAHVRRIVYLDADLYFFASPEILLAEAEGSSVQVIEHRFAPHFASLATYGRFNVGWIGFGTSEEGRRVITDYRRSCLEWCHDRVEGDRYADQKYLDSWPERYPACRVSDIKGANVAWWNMHRAEPRDFGGRLYMGADRLIFFHFQNIRRLPDGTYATKTDPAAYGPHYDAVHAPYLSELSGVDAEVRPLLADHRMGDVRYRSW